MWIPGTLVKAWNCFVMLTCSDKRQHLFWYLLSYLYIVFIYIALVKVACANKNICKSFLCLCVACFTAVYALYFVPVMQVDSVLPLGDCNLFTRVCICKLFSSGTFAMMNAGTLEPFLTRMCSVPTDDHSEWLLLTATILDLKSSWPFSPLMQLWPNCWSIGLLWWESDVRCCHRIHNLFLCIVQQDSSHSQLSPRGLAKKASL